MNNSNAHLSPEVVAQIKAAEKSIANELLLMQREGVPPLYLLTAMSMAIAELITTTIGPESVGPWFKNSAKMVENLQKQNGSNS